jgi:Tol biopolymer transport system component
MVASVGFARLLLAVAAALAFLWAAPAAAPATFAGLNGRIAFVSDRQNLGCDDCPLFSVWPDGSALTRLTGATPSVWFRPTWSPDGTKIAFPGDPAASDTNADVFVVNGSGSGLRNLTGTPDLSEGTVEWSPDGSRIAFGGHVPEAGSWEIFTIRPDGARLRRITFGSRFAGGLSWSPDGTQITYTQSPTGTVIEDRVVTVKTDGSGETKILATGFAPRWSPDGSGIAFLVRNDTDEIYSIRPDGTGLRRLTKNGFYEHSLTWSPDGSLLAFAGYATGTDTSAAIHVIQPDGTPVADFDQFASDLAWSPDGTKLVFTAQPNEDVRIIDVATGKLRDLVDSTVTRDRQPDWQPIPNDPDDFKSIAALCRAQRRALGPARFSAEYGGHRGGAFAACIRAHG